MLVSLFNRHNNTLDTRLLCPESREYLTSLLGYSLSDIDLGDLLPQTNAAGEEEPCQNEQQRKNEILENLTIFEENYKDSCESQHLQTQSKANKLRSWTIGAGLTTLALLAVATALILFVPPVAAVVLPLFAAIGTWSPWLLLTTLLPSLAVLIPSLISTRAEHKSQIQLDQRDSILRQIGQEKILIPIPAPQTIFNIQNESSNEVTNRPGPKRSTSETTFFTPPAGPTDQPIERDLINFTQSL